MSMGKKEQELEWAEAQKIVIKQDLVAAAKQQLQFLAAVDRNRHLYDGPALQHAICRYKNCWLPLLNKHVKADVTENPLVVPLDCEWIWHCHRLNPVQYEADCQEYYGCVLDNFNVVSSIQGECKKKTEEIWNIMYPNEPYELDYNSQIFKNVATNFSWASASIKYDLVSAVKRQSVFFYQVARSNLKEDIFLEEAVARYKGFLYLIKKNRENSIKRFCVPTYDIDLIWHSHQLHPVSYRKDLEAIMGKVLEHDDTDSDRAKRNKLDIGFSETTKQWEETFGSKYWKAGAMYRGSAPNPLGISFWQLNNTVSKKADLSYEFQPVLQFSKKMLAEVMLEIVGIRNLPTGYESNLLVSLRKKQPNLFFNTRKRLSISSKSGEKQVATFNCESTGVLVFELVSLAKVLGTTSIQLQDLMNPVSQLSMDNWFELVPSSAVAGSKPVGLNISFSFTNPVSAPYFLQIVQTHPSGKNSSSQKTKSWTCIVDDTGREVVGIQMRVRDSIKAKAGNTSPSRKEVIVMTASGETKVIAEFVGTAWLVMNSLWLGQPRKKLGENDCVFELTGSRKLIIFSGRKLEYETKRCEKQKNEQNFMTAVEFSEENPYGKAVALLNIKSGLLEIKEEWLVMPWIVLAFIFTDTLKVDVNGRKGEDNMMKQVLCVEGNVSDKGDAVIPKMGSIWIGDGGKNEVTIEGSEMILRDYNTCRGECENEYGAGIAQGGCGGGGCGGCGGGCGGGGGCRPGCGGGCGSNCGINEDGSQSKRI